MTTFSPVTEQEMNDFFARAIATIKAHANLSTELEQVRNDVAGMREQLNNVRAENDSLRRDNQAATDLAGQAEKERDEARRQFQAQTDRSNHLQDLITARDSRVQELSRDLDNANHSVESLNRENTNLSDRVASLEDQLKHVADRRDYWHDEADNHKTRADKAEAELAKLEKMLADIGFVRPKAEPVQVPITEAKPDYHPSQVDDLNLPSTAPEMKPVIHGNDGFEEEVHQNATDSPYPRPNVG